MKSWPELYLPDTGDITFPPLQLNASRGVGSYDDFDTVHT